MPGGTDKFKKSSHFCRTPTFFKSEGRFWKCPKCGSTFRCRSYKGRLSWLMVGDRRSK